MGHSFIQNRKSCFFFSAKKIQACFFFSRKSSHGIHSNLAKPNVFFNKMGCIFFFRIFGYFCCFFFPGKVHMSFIHSSEKAVFFFRSRKKKNSFFIHSIGFAQKCVKNELFREKKNTVPLVGPGSILMRSILF